MKKREAFAKHGERSSAKLLRRKSLLSYIILFLVSLTFTIGCVNPAIYIKTTNETDSASSAGVGAVRLGFSAWPGWFPWQVAQEEGIFKTNNVQVDLKWFDGYLESISTLIIFRRWKGETKMATDASCQCFKKWLRYFNIDSKERKLKESLNIP